MRAILLAAALPIMALAACGKPAPTKVTVNGESGQTQVQTGPAGAQVTVTDKAGQTTVIKAGAPAAALASAGAPAFAPAYPGAAVLSRVDTSQSGGATILKFTTKDTPDQVIAFYRTAAQKAGVPVSADMDMGPTKMFAAETEDGSEGLQLSVGAVGGQTVVQLSYHAKG
jgi:hypothetical protein